MGIHRGLPKHPMAFEILFIGQNHGYAIEESERVVGTDFVQKVRSIFDYIPLRQISCVIPFRLDIDVSLFVGYNTALTECEGAFSQTNQIICEVEEGELNFALDGPTAGILQPEVCQRPWTTSDKLIVEHFPQHEPEPPTFDSTNCVYFPCWQINSQKLFDWWKNYGIEKIIKPHSKPSRYDFLYGFYKTRFGFNYTGERTTAVINKINTTPEPYPFDQSLGDVWVNNFVRTTKCIEGHIETYDETFPPNDCENGSIIQLWKPNQDFYFNSENLELNWFDTEMGEYEIDGYEELVGDDIDTSSFLGGTDYPGRYYQDWFIEGGPYVFEGWQMMCCDRFITKYSWIVADPEENTGHRMPQFLGMWLKYGKAIEEWNEAEHLDPWDSSLVDPTVNDYS